MKKIISFLLTAIIAFGTIFTFSSCEKSEVKDPHLFDVLEQNLFGKTQDEIMAIDTNTSNKSYNPKEKEKDGYWRLNYTYKYEDGTGDAFVPDSGRWITQVKYFFDIDTKLLCNIEIRYMQTDYSEGQCSKRQEMITNYLNERFGEGTDTRIGTSWNIGNGQLTMSRQNGGWLLFNYVENVTDTLLIDTVKNGIIGKNSTQVKNFDPNTTKYSLSEEQTDDGSVVSYQIQNENGANDAFVEGGTGWNTTVEYHFDATTQLVNTMKIILTSTEGGSAQETRFHMLEVYFNNRFGYGTEGSTGTAWAIASSKIVMSSEEDGSVVITASKNVSETSYSTTAAQ